MFFKKSISIYEAAIAFNSIQKAITDSLVEYLDEIEELTEEDVVHTIIYVLFIAFLVFEEKMSETVNDELCKFYIESFSKEFNITPKKLSKELGKAEKIAEDFRSLTLMAPGTYAGKIPVVDAYYAYTTIKDPAAYIIESDNFTNQCFESLRIQLTSFIAKHNVRNVIKA
jgi:hypothetical protein